MGLTKQKQELLSSIDELEKYIVHYKKENEAKFKKIVVEKSQFKQAYRYLKFNKKDTERLIEIIIASGLDKNAAQQIFSIVMKYDNPNKFLKMLENKLLLHEFLACSNIVETVSKRFGLCPNLVTELLNYQPATQPVTGKVEAFICLCVQQAQKGKTGDITIDGQKFEIKGSGARLCSGIGHHGSTSAARGTFAICLRNLFRKANLCEWTLKFYDLKYDITATCDGAINDYAQQLTATKKVKKKDIVEVYVAGLKEIYEKASKQELRKWISRSIANDGTLKESFRAQYFIFALQYYVKHDQFDYLVVVETTTKSKHLGKITHISKTDIKNGYKILERLKVTAHPTYTPSASPQDKFFKIRVNANV